MNLRNNILLYRDAVLHSYSMVFFSLNHWFAGLVLVLSFLDPVAGFGGLFSVVVVNGLALLLDFNRQLVRNGDLGFNALLVGLGLGAYYEFSFSLVILLFFATVITLFITVILMGILMKYGLPFLSLPFVLGLWSVMLASRNFEALGVSQRGLYLLNELYAVGDSYLVDTYQWLNSLDFPLAIKTYFRSLGAILFQYNLLTGMVISLGLLLYSRLAFLLSLLGFVTAFGFYEFIGADLNQLNYNYIGFNFILSAIAVGGIYLVASGWSFLWVLVLVPLLTILTGSLTNLLAAFQLGVYALPFNVVVLSFLYVLKWRTHQRRPDLVTVQHYVPEYNRYHHLSNQRRFRNYRSIPVRLPVMGEWRVSQAHDGAITHRAEWRHAWDFIMVDAEGRSYRNQGTKPEDFLCYDKPVIAPADGTVAELMDGIEDNAVGDTNLEQNWGNSLVIDHGYGLYSQLSHLRQGSFQVETGDRVHKGQILAHCGNSGRSPEPHLHFQLQATPYVGAPTLEYPIAMYLADDGKQGKVFHLFDFPEKEEKVQNAETLELMKYAFSFVPGRRLLFALDDGRREEWECRTDPYNNAYIECLRSGARAYYHNNGSLHYFTNFTGNRNSLLYHFFLAHFQVALGYQERLRIEDYIPLHLVRKDLGRWLQDLLSPFYQFSEARYQLDYQEMTGAFEPESIQLEAKVTEKRWGKERQRYQYLTLIRDYHIETFTVRSDRKTSTARWIEERSDGTDEKT